MLREGIARRYARSLLEVTLAHQIYDQVFQELKAVEGLFRDIPPLVHALERPTVPRHQKEALLKDLQTRLRLHSMTIRFLTLLVENRRIRHLSRILDLLEKMYLESQGYQTVEVITATPLDNALRDRFREALETFTGRKVIMEERVDPDILGGFIIRIGSVYYDGSLTNQIRQIRNQLVGEVFHGYHDSTR